MRVLIVLALIVVSDSFLLRGSVDDQLPERLIPGLAVVIDAAMANSSTMGDRALAEVEAEGLRISRRASVLPHFSTNLSYYQEDDIASTSEAGFEERLVYSVVLQQPLFHWGARSAAKDIGRILYDIELLNTSVASDRLRARVRSLYLALVLAKLELETATEDVSLKRREYETQEERKEQGLVSAGAMFNIQLNLDKSELARLQSESNWADKLWELSIFSGVDEEDLVDQLINEIPMLEPLSLESIQQLRLDLDANVEHSEIVAKQSRNIEIKRKELDIERVALRPKVNMQAGMSQNARDLNGVRREQEYLYVGFRATWNIFDGHQAKGKKMTALARLQRSEDSKEQLRIQLKRSGRKTLFALEMASRWLGIQEKEFRNREHGLSMVLDDFERGRISDVNVEEARQRHRKSVLDTQKKRIAYLNALSAVSVLLGK